MVPCRRKKKSGKKQSMHDGVEQPDDDRPQQCTSNTSKHTKLNLYASASPNSLHCNGKKSTQTKKKPVQTGKKSAQTNSNSMQHGELDGCTASGGSPHTYDEVADPTDNITGLILIDPNHCHCHRMGKMLK